MRKIQSYEFQCATCGKVDKKESTREELMEELNKNFPGATIFDSELVCEDCYQKALKEIKMPNSSKGTTVFRHVNTSTLSPLFLKATIFSVQCECHSLMDERDNILRCYNIECKNYEIEYNKREYVMLVKRRNA